MIINLLSQGIRLLSSCLILFFFSGLLLNSLCFAMQNEGREETKKRSPVSSKPSVVHKKSSSTSQSKSEKRKEDSDSADECAEKFNFNDLSHDEGDPSTYTLVCLDSNLIGGEDKNDKLMRQDLAPVKKWLNPKLLRQLVEKEKDHNEVRITSHPDGKPEASYYIVSGYKKKKIHSSAAENFIASLEKRDLPLTEESIFSFCMIIFPQNERYALAYLLGQWSQLINSHAIVPDWGLRLTASKAIFSDNEGSIKHLIGKQNSDPNPTTRKEKKEKLAFLKNFSLEVGTEGLKSLRVIPKYVQDSSTRKSLVLGEDRFQFSLPEAKKGDATFTTIESLEKMATYLFGLYTQGLRIHKKLKPYIDEPEEDSNKIHDLNAELKRILGSGKAEQQIFPSDFIWKTYGKSPIFTYEGKRHFSFRELLKALKGNELSIESQILIQQSEKKKSKKDSSKGEPEDDPSKGEPEDAPSMEEPLGRIIYTLPLENGEENFYRFDRGLWFKVSSSRFGPIIRKMRTPEIKGSQSTILYPEYTLDDAKGDGSGKDLYQEARYNQRLVAEQEPNTAILLDRLNIFLGGLGNKFEFGDMLLFGEKGQIYIVHVKRREAGDIDHHRAQVERCAEYLSTELSKKNAANLLLQGHVHGLYEEHEISSTKVKNQGKRLTHGDYFKKTFSSKKKEKKETWENFITSKILCSETKEKSTVIEDLKKGIRNTKELKYFKDYEEEFIIALDALYDCAQELKREGKDPLDPQKIENFLEGVKQCIETKKSLFPNGVLTEEERKKITIVMAVIDDRKIEDIKKAEKKLEDARKNRQKPERDKKVAEAETELNKLKDQDRSKEGEVFKKQHLWGLDRTCRLVQQKGFDFNLVVINENKDRSDWDAFGPITPVQLDSPSDDSEDEEKSPPKKQKKKKRSGATDKTKSSGKKGRDEDDSQINISTTFKNTKKLGMKDTVDLYKIQKFTYGASDSAQGLYGEYLSCPTPPDGDCFFHAVFTQEGEDVETVSERAAVMRETLCDEVLTGNYLTGCRNLVYEHYFEMLTTPGVSKIPEATRQLLKDNEEHQSARNYLISHGMDPKDLPPLLGPEFKHDENIIKTGISLSDVQAYMGRFRTKAGPDSYIPVREGMICPAEKIALQNNVRINVFTFNAESGSLELFKSAGNVGADGNHPIVNILHGGNHFVALIHPDESDLRKAAVHQIMKNYRNHSVRL